MSSMTSAAAAAVAWGAFFVLVCVLLVAVEPLSWQEAAYFAAVSVSTVGMGDVVPVSALGRLVTGAAIVVHTVFFASLLSMAVARGALGARVNLASALATLTVATVAALMAAERLSFADALWYVVVWQRGCVSWHRLTVAG